MTNETTLESDVYEISTIREIANDLFPKPNAKIKKMVCGNCWGSGWEIQFIESCKKCEGNGVL